MNPLTPDATALVLIAALVLFSGWMLYEHRQINRKFRDEQKARDTLFASLSSAYAVADAQMAKAHDLRISTVEAVVAKAAPASHDHADLYASATHDHTGGPQGHVHWLKYASTEITDGKRRDVYTCLVPDCKAIFGHHPEV